MTKSILNLEGVQVLSKKEQKNVKGGKFTGDVGGRGCKLVAPNGHGGYTTYIGACDTYTSVHYDSITGTTPVYSTNHSFCNIGDGVAYPLAGGSSSNC